MNYDKDVERLLTIAMSGDRREARTFVDGLFARGFSASEVLSEVVMKAVDAFDVMERQDRITLAASNVAARVLRVVIARVCENGPPEKVTGRTIAMYCGASLNEELISEAMARLLEYDGHTVYFGGGGIPADEIEQLAIEAKPCVLLLYASSAFDTPGIRQLIDSIRATNTCPNMQIAVGGGVFDRAPGLAEEIGADLWALDREDLLKSLIDDTFRRAIPSQQTVGRGRRGTNRAVA